MIVVVVMVIIATKESGSLLDVAFVRKEGTVILISNPNPFEVFCILSQKQGSWGTEPTVPPRGSVLVVVPEALAATWIGGSCQRMPSQLREWLWRLQDVLGIIPMRKTEDWEISVGIPAPNSPSR